MLIRQEDDLLPPAERPFEDQPRVAAGAAGPVVLPAEGLDGRGGVDVGDGNDGGRRRVGQEGPRFLQLVDGRHVGHAATGGQVGEDDLDRIAGEDVGGFGHEMDAAEYDVFRIGLGGRDLGQLETVAREVGEADDLVLLIMVPEDHERVAGGALMLRDLLGRLLVGRLGVLKWQGWLKQHALFSEEAISSQRSASRGDGRLTSPRGMDAETLRPHRGPR